MWKLRRFLKDYRKQVIIGPIFKWMEAVLELIVPTRDMYFGWAGCCCSLRR